ncbi:hypothetical protein IFR05_015475, partial [Cadophora sp. M221]
ALIFMGKRAGPSQDEKRVKPVSVLDDQDPDGSYAHPTTGCSLIGAAPSPHSILRRFNTSCGSISRRRKTLLGIEAEQSRGYCTGYCCMATSDQDRRSALRA